MKKRQMEGAGWFAVCIGVVFCLWGLTLFLSIPRESELIEAAGVPTDLQEHVHQQRNGTNVSMTFRLAGNPVVVADHSPTLFRDY